MLLPSSEISLILKVEATGFLETVINFSHTTRNHISGGCNRRC